MVRTFIDDVLNFIGAPTLTDEEFETIELVSADWNKDTYVVIRDILIAREAVSTETKRLKLYFIAKGVDIKDAPKPVFPNSNIFIGSPL